MCNAYNHAPDCRCGWGGDGHLGTGGGRPLPAPLAFSVAPAYRRLESYVNPNARCPVCGVPVFFYRSTDGGRVFFDELGPPWPKHPCTNRSSPAERSAGDLPFEVIFPEVGGAVKPPHWQRDGWRPFIYDDIGEVRPPRPHALIRGTWEGKPKTLYVAARSLPKVGLYQVRHLDVAKYEVSVFYITSNKAPPKVAYFKGFESPTRAAAVLARNHRSKFARTPSTVPAVKTAPGKGTTEAQSREGQARRGAKQSKAPEKRRVTDYTTEQSTITRKGANGKERVISVTSRKKRTLGT